ncbi:MAG TPA: RNA methyltransferase [Candidatus Krumholzibacteriaceae bacterium]|nr:RNA methyltransferase [Candidatus Krumholzibacteriaceae bacterium]
MNTDNSKNITSAKNPGIKSLIRLRKKNERDKTGLTSIEGVRELNAAIYEGIPLKDVYCCPVIIKSDEEISLLNTLKKQKYGIITVSRHVFGKIAYRGTTGGFVAVAAPREKGLEDLRKVPNPSYLVADNVEKPGNIGALLRTAGGAGVSALIASDLKTDLFNPNIIRSSLGAVFTVPTAKAGSDEIIEWLKRNKINIISTSPDSELIYTDADFTLPCAVILGSENRGLSKNWFIASDYIVNIPMKGDVDSLNVSTAGAVLLYEILRQRSIKS